MSFKSEQCLRAAMALEKAGNLESAFAMYQEALLLLFEDLKTETDPSKRGVLQSIISTYMESAEKLKQQLALRVPPKPPRRDSHTDSISSAAVLLPPQPPSPAGQSPAPSPSAAVSSQASKSTTRQQGSGKPDSFDYCTIRTPTGTTTSKLPATTTTRTSAAHNRTTNRTTGTTSASARTPTTTKAAAGKGAAAASSPANDKNTEYENQILEEMLDSSPGVSWSDIAGLAYAKQTLQEAVILPNLRPDLFTGLRSPPRGVLLFGPPGTGKTLLAKAVATESRFAFFSITASSVMSKYIGEGEKLMKALFSVARKKEPAVIFFDEIDAIMSARKENEHEASRRIKTEFMTQIDGAATGREERLLIMAATNIPWELDEAVLRRLVKRIYVPLPDAEARKALIVHLIEKHHRQSGRTVPSIVSAQAAETAEVYPDEQEAKAPSSTTSSVWNVLTGNPRSVTKSSKTARPVSAASPPRLVVDDNDVGEILEPHLARIVALTDGYSGSDLNALCHEAAMGPIREIGISALRTIRPEDVRSLALKDFTTSISIIRPSVSPESLLQYVRWAEQFGVTK